MFVYTVCVCVCLGVSGCVWVCLGACACIPAPLRVSVCVCLYVHVCVCAVPEPRECSVLWWDEDEMQPLLPRSPARRRPSQITLAEEGRAGLRRAEQACRGTRVT